MINLNNKKIAIIYCLIFLICIKNKCLDTSYGTNGTGIVTFDINAGVDSVINDTVIQPSDGKTIVTGYSAGTNGQQFFCTVRYNTTGTLDTSFGNNGTVITNIGQVSEATAIGIQADNKIVIGGWSNDGSITSFALARYNTDGSLDTNFGTNGIVTTTISTNGSTINSLVIRSDQLIVAAGTAGINYAAARYNTDGSLDTSFGGGLGYISVAIPNVQVAAYGLAIQPDNKIVATGFYKPGNVEAQMVVVRGNANGALDLTFGTNGVVKANIGNKSVGNFLALDAGGNVVVVGSTANVNANNTFLVVRLTSSGAFDSTFGTNGIVTTAIGDISQAYDVALQADGKIVVVGSTTSSSNFLNQFAIARYNTDGSLDNTFGTNGIITTAIGNNSIANAVDLQTNQKILAAGFGIANGETNLSFTLAQYNTSNEFSLDISTPINSSTITTKIPSIFLTGSITGAEVDVLVDRTLLTTGLLSSTGAFNAGITLPLTNTTHTILANLIVTGSTVLSVENVFTVDAPDPEFGGVLRVDSIFGSDTNGQRNNFPFKTINGALSQTQSGDTVWIYPGTYYENFIIPTGISIKGLNSNACNISKQNVNTGTDLITMGENSRLEDLSLKLTSTGHYLLRGIVFPGTTSYTAKVKNSSLTIDNSTAWTTGSSNIYGIHSNGTGQPDSSNIAINNSSIVVKSNGTGAKRGVLLDAANKFNISNTQILVTGGNFAFGVETSNGNAQFTSYASSIFGSGADVSILTGNMILNSTILENGTVNTGVFLTKVYPLNYIYAYDTTSQTLNSGTLGNITFNTNGAINGWQHSTTSSTQTFTCPQTGTYLISYDLFFIRTGGAALVSAVILQNGAQIAGSQANNQSSAANIACNVAKDFIVSLNKGDTIVLQAGSNNTTTSIAPAGQGTIRPSANLSIVRLS